LPTDGLCEPVLCVLRTERSMDAGLVGECFDCRSAAVVEAVGVDELDVMAVSGGSFEIACESVDAYQ
jgi:hypothetical protein